MSKNNENLKEVSAKNEIKTSNQRCELVNQTWCYWMIILVGIKFEDPIAFHHLKMKQREWMDKNEMQSMRDGEGRQKIWKKGGKNKTGSVR